MKPSAEQRLNACCDKLKEDGVADVKFYFSHLSEKPLSTVTNDAAEVLEAIINQEYSEMKAVGDTQGRPTSL